VILELLDLVVRRAHREIDRVDRVAATWLLRRTDLPRSLVVPLLESLAARVGAKLEMTDI
jgi:hypothetical protein